LIAKHLQNKKKEKKMKKRVDNCDVLCYAIPSYERYD
jgi:hypothetical protein